LSLGAARARRPRTPAARPMPAAVPEDWRNVRRVAADGRVGGVAVHVDLDLSLAPPVIVCGADADDGPDESSLLVPLRQQVEVLLERGGVLATKEHVQPADVRGMGVAQGVIDLVEERLCLRPVVRQGEPRAADEGHGQVNAHAGLPADGMDGARVGHDLAVGEAEEIAHRALDARVLLAVPVGAEDEAAQVDGFAPRGHPDVADDARAGDVAERDGAPGQDVLHRPALASGAEIAGGLASLAGLAGRILERDGARHEAGVEPVRLRDEVHRPPLGLLASDGCRQQKNDRQNRHCYMIRRHGPSPFRADPVSVGVCRVPVCLTVRAGYYNETSRAAGRGTCLALSF